MIRSQSSLRMRGSYPTGYFVALTAFAVWLCVFSQALHFWALGSLLLCVVGGFSWLGFRRDGAPASPNLKAKWVKIGLLLTALVLLDVFLAPPGLPEIGIQVALIGLLVLRLLGRI